MKFSMIGQEKDDISIQMTAKTFKLFEFPIFDSDLFKVIPEMCRTH
jgi:hypothetical protein